MATNVEMKMRKKWIYHIGRFLLAGLFIWSGTIKLLDPAVFGVVIEAFGIVPELLLPALSYIIPLLEVAFGLALIVDLKGALTGITLMVIFFMLILGYGIHLGLDIDCGCFGPSDPELKAFSGLRSAFYRDIAILAMVGLLYFLRHRLDIKPLPINLRKTEHRGV